MAEFNSREYANVLATPPNKLKPNQFGGETRVASMETPATAAWADGDTLNGPLIPKGSRILGFTVVHEAFGSSVTLDLGTSGDADAFYSGLDISSAGTSYIVSDDVAELAEATRVIASVLDANPTDDAQMTVFVHYVKT